MIDSYYAVYNKRGKKVQITKKTLTEINYREEMENYLQNLIKEEKSSQISIVNDFAKYASRQQITRFLAYNEIFQKILSIPGSIIECGVYSGQGLMTWAQLSAIYEPVGGIFREVYGFDTFSGFPDINEKDLKNTSGVVHENGDFFMDKYEDLLKTIALFDQNRFLSQFPKVHLIRGDFLETGQTFFDHYPHVIPALLSLDFDLYEPTKKALEIFLPRMFKGSVIVFDELNNASWPGETLAMLESLNMSTTSFRKINYEPNISYAIID